MILKEETLQTRYIYRGKIINVRIDDVLLPDGFQSKREVVEHNGAVAVVPANAQNEVICVRQFRKPVEKALLEIPAGRLEPGETAEECAQRELVEEIGYRAGQLLPLASFYASPGFSSEKIHLYLALDLQAEAGKKPAGEYLKVEVFPLPEFLKMIEKGVIEDGKTLLGLLLALKFLETG